MLRYLLAGLITLSCFFVGAQALNVAPKILELELMVEADADILFNHVNPIYFTLSSFYGGREQEATGEIYVDDPEIYWHSLNPVMWRLELPQSLSTLDVKVNAKLALCDKQKGLCYFQEVALREVVRVNQAINKQTLTLTLALPDY